MVLPFRMLRSDPDIDFLAFSVPDAVAGALSVLDSVVVRSPAGTARYVGENLDLKQIAEETHGRGGTDRNYSTSWRSNPCRLSTIASAGWCDALVARTGREYV